MMQSRLRLFCLPYSGASAMVYARWRRSLPSWVELLPLELPGRGRRFNEALQTDMQALANQLASELSAVVEQPYALFGHSLGGLLAFELAHALRRLGLPSPQAVFASAAPAPSRRESHLELAQELSDEQLLQRLRSLGGTPEAVFADAEMLSLTLPVLRADFLLCGRYRYQPRARLECPIHVLAGKADRVSVDALADWQNETADDFSLEMFEGGHFFINTCEAQLLEQMLGKLHERGRNHQAVRV